jgi:hypothetical protein
MNWISVNQRVPDDRCQVLAWGVASILGATRTHCLGITRFNPSPRGGTWDIEKMCWSLRIPIVHIVTHWAEIVPPKQPDVLPPPKKP